jgi:hypothetical protein
MIYVLQYLYQDAASREDLSDQLAEEMANMSEVIKDFRSSSEI